jgi:uncharacterized membrane protein
VVLVERGGWRALARIFVVKMSRRDIKIPMLQVSFAGKTFVCVNTAKFMKYMT